MARNVMFVLLVLFGVFVSNVHLANHRAQSERDHEKRECEEITVPMCRGIGYNLTSMPNQFHHETQEEAGLEVHQFFPLVEISCSEDLRFFLCSLYTPLCMVDYHGSVPACRSVCERAKKGCEPLMIQYGFQWPEHMDCSKFPVYNDPLNICMDPSRMNHSSSNNNMNTDDGEDKHGGKMHGGKEPRIKQNIRKNYHQTTHYTTEPYGSAYPENNRINNNNNNNHLNSNHNHVGKIDGLDSDHSVSVMNTGNHGSTGCRCDCREPYFVRIRHDVYYEAASSNYEQHPASQLYPTNYFNHSRIETAGGLAPFCASSCKNAYGFTDVQRESAMSWINIAALICVVTCLLTFLTYMIDSRRFHYPERAIIFLAACYICIASGYLLRIQMGHSAIACDGLVIRYQRTGPTPASCLVSFILLYFFGMASAYWWLILTLTWFLAAGLNWGSEAITGYAQYFHLLAWLLPTAQSVAILCLGAIDGDPFAGLCTVGNQSRANLLIFVITPLCVCITIGSLFLIAGFVALFRIRQRVVRQRQNIRVKTDSLEKVMMKIGLSSFFYIVPEGVVLACHIYEYIYRPHWEKTLTCICGNDSTETIQPYFPMILLKYIMSLIIGITSGFWIWSGKTLDLWLQFYGKFACCRGKFGSPSNSRSGASQLLPNMTGYYGRGVQMTMGNASLPIKNPTVNLTPINGSSVNSTPQHLLHQNAHLHHLHTHHGLELQSRQNGQQLIHPLPSLPPSLPPPPPPLIISGNRHGGSLTGSQFMHLIGTINGNGTNGNSKVPLSHV
ncbi:hypothetical protein RDWZM_007677 [Blomia tropicalis]|uniref:Uncharacterized protein n=1 Tax=Blomia tropicalis TaxID=40697 RepID=A0A9Q0RJN0_BLOTA|nr:hypothetical protein RDWZM_007677 [Blomia tropicalis]